MAADHLQFLKIRFIRELQEADEEFGGKLPLHPEFKDVEKFLQERTINPSTPIGMKNLLYDLIHELKECNMLAEKERDREKERERRIRSKKSRFDVQIYKIKVRMTTTMTNAKKRYFIYTTRKKLLRIKGNLKLMKDAAATVAESSLPSDSIKVWNPSWVQRQAACGNIHGFDEELRKIKALLLEQADDNGIKTIGIVGMSGVGKTTLARMVVNDQDCRVFEPIIWVTLSQNSDPSEIIKQMLGKLSPNDNDAQIISVVPDSPPAQLRELQSLLFSKRYLVVLDNVWHQDEWYSDLASSVQPEGTISVNRLCHGLPKGSGGAVIVTSGFEEVAASMVGEENWFRLQPLFNEDAPIEDQKKFADALWSIFWDSIKRKKFLTSDHHQRLERMKDEIIYRCDGLPLAAKTLAEVISIQMGWTRYWSNSYARQEFCLRVDQLDDISFCEAVKKVENVPGVDDVTASIGVGEITILGRCLPVEIARELGKLWPTELISVELEKIPTRVSSSLQKFVFKLDLHDDKDLNKAMKIVSKIEGTDYVSMDMKDKKLTVFGNFDPLKAERKMRKHWPTDIISGGPGSASQPLKKEKRETKMLFSSIFRCLTIN